MIIKKISIITINLNNAKGLSKTIESVLCQTCPEFEYIIIDGASSDGSIDILKKHSDSINSWVSESDTGIYNAMNKGIMKATGEYCLFLNSGDWLADESVITDFIAGEFKEELIAGTVNYVNGIGRKYIQPTPDKLTYDFFVNDTLMHPATFIKRELFLKYGFYNENFRIVSDWEFFFKTVILYNCSYNIIERVIANVDMQGISWQKSWDDLRNKEQRQVLSTLIPRVYPLHIELEELRAIRQKYDFLKAGRFGFIVEILLKLKSIKKRIST